MAVAQKVDPDTVLKSNRFAPISSQLWTRILRPTFAGWWIAQGAPGKPQSPAQSDFVVLFIHGGAYISGHPFGKAAQLLRVWELVAEKGQSMSIFGLQYTVAPEGRFPRPIKEAEAAYRYLVDELLVDPSKIVLIGESAGGHLVLALLQRLQEIGRPKPGYALLLYPWVDLTNSGVSHTTNKSNDILNTPNLDVAARKVVGPDGEKKFATLMNYAVPHPDRASLKDILPKTWVTIGSWDTFYSSNISFVDQAKKDGAIVKLHVAEGWPHGWTSMADVNSTKAYLKLQRVQPLETPMEGAQCIFDGLMSLL
jgi:acetyl esterase/lipase